MGVEKENPVGDGMEDAARESKILEISRLYAAINQKVEEFVVGNRPLIDSILIALLSEGHILIEGVPEPQRQR